MTESCTRLYKYFTANRKILKIELHACNSTDKLELNYLSLSRLTLGSLICVPFLYLYLCLFFAPPTNFNFYVPNSTLLHCNLQSILPRFLWRFKQSASSSPHHPASSCWLPEFPPPPEFYPRRLGYPRDCATSGPSCPVAYPP